MYVYMYSTCSCRKPIGKCYGLRKEVNHFWYISVCCETRDLFIH